MTTTLTTTTIAPLPTELGVDAAAAVRDIARRIANGRTITMILDGDLRNSWAALTQAGWADVGVRDASGDGATLVDLVTVAVAWGETCLPLPLIPTILARRWSPSAAAHEGPVTLSVPHPSREGGLVPFGARTEVLLAPALGEADRAPARTACEVETLAPTLALGRAVATTALSPAAAHECAVVWAAEAVGAATRLLSEAVEYVKLREQFRRPIGSFQAIKHMLADAHIAVEQAETAVLWAATEPDQARRAITFAFRCTRRVGEISVQAHGGVGFTWELGLHFYLRHIMALAELAAGVMP